MDRDNIIKNLLYEMSRMENERSDDYSGYRAIKNAIKWILPANFTVFDNDYICIECGCEIYPIDIENGSYRYCPNCGRKALFEE